MALLTDKLEQVAANGVAVTYDITPLQQSFLDDLMGNSYALAVVTGILLAIFGILTLILLLGSLGEDSSDLFVMGMMAAIPAVVSLCLMVSAIRGYHQLKDEPLYSLYQRQMKDKDVPHPRHLEHLCLSQSGFWDGASKVGVEVEKTKTEVKTRVKDVVNINWICTKCDSITREQMDLVSAQTDGTH